jgi:hypothetical protein
MKRVWILLAGAAVLYAQTDPLSTEVKQAWTRTIGNAVAGAEKMPEDGYAFKPTPESMSFRDIVAQAAQAECEKAYTLTDAKAMEVVTGGRGGPRSRLSTLWGNTVHIEHEYAQMAVLLRLKGVVPPSSDRK